MSQTRKRPKLDSTSPSISTKCMPPVTPAVVSLKQADTTEVKNATILLVKEGIQEKRFGLVKKFAEKNGFQCEEQFSERVSYVVTDLGDFDQICRLHPHLACLPLTPVVSSRWLYASVREKNQVPTASFLVPGYDAWQVGVRQTPPQQQPLPEPQQPTSAPQPTSEPHQPTSKPPQPVAKTLESFSDTSSAPLPSLMKNNTSNQCPVTTTSLEAVTFDKEAFNNNPLERNAPLTHHNAKLVEPLTFMSNYWSTLGDEQRSLAYTTAAATLKCLPFTATTTSQIADLKGVGSGHCLKVLREILDTGSCQEIIVKRQSEKYLRIKNLTGVYGVGISLAEKLHNSHGITNGTDMVARWEDLNLHDERIKYGVAYYDDLNTPVTQEMADRIQAIVWKELDGIREGCRLELTGGFRRGKPNGHDVDFLICSDYDDTTEGMSRSEERRKRKYAENEREERRDEDEDRKDNKGSIRMYTEDERREGRNEEGSKKDDLLYQLLSRLRRSGFILQARLDRPMPHQEADFKKQANKVNTMDNFEKCFCIMRCPLHDTLTPNPTPYVSKDFANLIEEGRKQNRTWRATRVDLVLVPRRSQWPYAVLGWSGSKLFERLLRRHANAALGLTLTSHGLWSKARGCLLPAETEEDIFTHLGLTFKPPSLRNF